MMNKLTNSQNLDKLFAQAMKSQKWVLCDTCLPAVTESGIYLVSFNGRVDLSMWNGHEWGWQDASGAWTKHKNVTAYNLPRLPLYGR